MAKGESHASLSLQPFQSVVPEVCESIWKHKDIALKKPSNSDDWRLIAAKFWERWQFPHCLGGKHRRKACGHDEAMEIREGRNEALLVLTGLKQRSNRANRPQGRLY